MYNLNYKNNIKINKNKIFLQFYTHFLGNYQEFSGGMTQSSRVKKLWKQLVKGDSVLQDLSSKYRQVHLGFEMFMVLTASRWDIAMCQSFDHRYVLLEMLDSCNKIYQSM